MAEALKYETIFFLIGIAAGLILILPFFNSLVFAAVFAFMIYPVHKALTKYTSETMSAAVLTFILMAIVTIFLVLGAKLILDELATIYFYVIGLDFNTLFAGREELAVSFEAISGFVFTQLINYSSSFVSRLPSLALSFVVFIFTLFFFIRDGAKTFAWFEKNLPIADVIKRGIFKDIQNYASAFINVWLVIGAVQALMATIGFYLFGLPYPIAAGLIAGIFSILPSIGPFALYLPVGAYYIFSGDPVIGTGIIIYGIIIGSVLDYIVRPYLAGKWSNAHPLVILLGVFGGIAFLGPSGIIVGPIVLLIAVSLLKEITTKSKQPNL